MSSVLPCICLLCFRSILIRCRQPCSHAMSPRQSNRSERKNARNAPFRVALALWASHAWQHAVEGLNSLWFWHTTDLNCIYLFYWHTNNCRLLHARYSLTAVSKHCDHKKKKYKKICSCSVIGNSYFSFIPCKYLDFVYIFLFMQKPPKKFFSVFHSHTLVLQGIAT